MEDHPSPHASHVRRGALKGGRSSTSPTLAAGQCTGGAGLLAAVLLLAACAGSSGSPAGEAPSAATLGPAPSSDGTDPVADTLTIELDRGDGSPVQRYTLSCADPVEGDLPDAEAACAHLRGLADPFAPLAPDAMCTEQYGGPQTARVTGRWGDGDVDLALSRTDGCRISQWDRLGPLLPGPVGVLPD